MGRPKGSKNKSKDVTENVAPENTVTPEAPVSGEIVESSVTKIEQAPEPVKEQALAPAQPKREAALSIVGGVTTEQLKQALTVQTEQRALIQEFIKENLVVDIDYGKIHVVKNCQAEDRQRGSCDRDYHYSKSILFKPGQEKIFSLFGIQDELIKDEEAYAMLQNVPGLVAYKCIMYRGENKIGEGRGAATLSATQNDPNSTIKKAEKRARMDACLSLGFSAYFTQDLDDPEYKSQREMMNEKARNEAERRDRDEFGLMPRDPEQPIDGDERTKLFAMILAYGIDKYYVLDSLRLNGIENPGAMKSGEARMLMAAIKNNAFKKPEQPEIPEDPVTVPDSQLPEDIYPQRPKAQEMDLVVDDDLKDYVQKEFSDLNFNARGALWFMKFVSGKPFGKFEEFTDDEWRRAYNHIDDILNVRIEVDSDYFNSDEPAPADPADKIKEMFPGAEVLEQPDGTKVIKSTGEIIDDENPIPEDLR